MGNYDFIYYNEVVKPALVGLAGPWISGGIEFNWPQHHRPTTFMPLEAVEEENPDGGKTVWTGEVEPFGRMKGMAGITVDKGISYIKTKVRVYNRTAFPQVFMWWANLAVPVNDDYRTVFPPDCEWVNDHDRRAVLEWPIAKGVYKTARPYNFGEGTDLSHYSAVKVPSSYLISQGQSDMDFVAGYDTGINKGIATVANHHISPGKKMWHWGIGDFGDMWCSNLTDKKGPYIELMTGVYTDNQPDFTWIAPYETREFEQYWYPVREIGEIKNATIDAAVEAARIARENGVRVLYDCGGLYDGVKKLLALTDIMIPSEEFAIGHTGASSAEEAAKKLYEMYKPAVVVVTQGKKGGLLYQGDGVIYYPIYPAKVVDSNGSGDVFHGAFAAAVVKGFDYKKCCHFSSAVSAIKCTKVGARESVPDYETVKIFLKENGYEL